MEQTPSEGNQKSSTESEKVTTEELKELEEAQMGKVEPHPEDLVVPIAEGEKAPEEKAEGKKEKTEKDLLVEKLDGARKECVDALYVKEKAEHDVKKLSGIRGMFGAMIDKITGKPSRGDEKEGAKSDAVAWEKVYKGKQEVFKGTLKEYRGYLVKEKEAELNKLVGEGKMQKEESDKELEKYAKEVAEETITKEAIKLFDAKENLRIQEMGTTRKWLAEKTSGIAEWYRKQPTKVKIAVSVGLGIGGVAGGLAGGVPGALILSAAFAGRTGMRILGGMATTAGVERGMKIIQERGAEKEIGKEKEFASNFLEALKEKNNKLDDKLFEILGRKGGQKRNRYIVAGVAGGIVGSGLAAQAFNSLIPAEWKTIIAEKLGFRAMIPGRPSFEESPGRPQISKWPEEELLQEKPTGGGIGPLEEPEASTGGVSPESVKAGVNEDYWQRHPELKFSAIETVKKGDSVWKIIERQAEARGLFKGFSGSPDDIAAKKTYIIDALKDKVAVQPDKFGLKDIDKLKIGQKINIEEIFKSPEELNKITGAAGKLGKEQLANILKNNEILKDWVKANPGEFLTSEKTQQILTGKIPEEVFPWQAEELIELKVGRPQISAIPKEVGEISAKPQGEPLPASVKELEQMGFKKGEIADLGERAKLSGKNFVTGSVWENYANDLRKSGHFDITDKDGVITRPTEAALAIRLDETIAGTLGMEPSAYDTFKEMNLEKFVQAKPATLGEHFEWKPAKKAVDQYLKINKFLDPDDLKKTVGDFFKKIIKIDIGK